ncbi:hypothetical protein VTO42DRAFT_7944 [Malbranchea cinnamomea]
MSSVVGVDRIQGISTETSTSCSMWYAYYFANDVDFAIKLNIDARVALSSFPCQPCFFFLGGIQRTNTVLWYEVSENSRGARQSWLEAAFLIGQFAPSGLTVM